MQTRLIMSAAVLAMAATPLLAGGGNGITLSGDQYELNIIGVDQAKKPPLTGSNRHTIFVPLVTGDPVGGVDINPVPGHEIWLQQGATFQVCDGNGFDIAWDCNTPQAPLIVPSPGGPVQAYGATFQLPCDTEVSGTVYPCSATPGGSVQSAEYEVWARVEGTPNTNGGTIETCAYDTLISPAAYVCSTNVTPLLIKNKSNKFIDVTAQLTTISYGGLTYTLFSPGFQAFYWDYDNNGNKLLQLRFILEQ